MTDTKTQANSTKRVPAVAVSIFPTYRNTISKDADAWEGADGAWLEFKAANGKRLEFSTDRLTAGLMMRATAHGLKQKLVDATAISRDPETGRSATVDDKWSALVAVYDRLMSGEWNLPREGGGSGSLLFKAICRVYADKAPEALKAWLDGKTDEQKKALRLNAKIAAAIAEIQAEQAKDSDIDSDELLDEIDDLAA